MRFGPFEHVAWASDKKEAVDLFWEWHEYLKSGCGYQSANEAKAAFSVLKEQLLKKEPQNVIPHTLLGRIEAVSATYDLPLEWFYDQLDAAHYFYGGFKFQDAKQLKDFVNSWEAPHTYLLGKLADAAYTWQRNLLNEFAMAFFIVNGLLHLKEDLKQNRLFIPDSEMHHAEATLEQLKKGELTSGLERLLWKQTIRARDAFAQGQPLIKELDRKYRGAVKKNWLTALEYINEIEKRKYDVWTEPITLSSMQKFQIFVLSWIGKGVRQGRG